MANNSSSSNSSSNNNNNTAPVSEKTEEPVERRGPGRKKKRKHCAVMNKIKEEKKSDDSSDVEYIPKLTSKPKPDETDYEPDQKKLKLTSTTSSIVTRGAKLPNFGLWHHHTHSFHYTGKRGRPRIIKHHAFPGASTIRKVGRPLGSTKKVMAQIRKRRLKKEVEEIVIGSDTEEDKPEIPKPVLLQSNPLEWSVEDVVQYLQKTPYAPIAPLLKEQEIDGQALLMLNLFNVQEYLHLKPEPAKRFCYLIKDLKIEFFSHYSS